MSPFFSTLGLDAARATHVIAPTRTAPATTEVEELSENTDDKHAGSCTILSKKLPYWSMWWILCPVVPVNNVDAKLNINSLPCVTKLSV